MNDQYFEHQELIKRTQLLAGETWPNNIRLFNRHVGLFYKKRINQELVEYSPIPIGKKGQCDNWGVFSFYIFPLHLELEYKTGKAKLNPDQIIWRDFSISMGWLWFEVRNEHQFISDLSKKLLSLEQGFKNGFR